ncbi:cytochrome c oxidase assembly protein [Rhodococcus aerolatus]
MARLLELPDRPPATTPVIGAALAVSGTVAAAVAALSTTSALSLLGLPDPGALTTVGLPLIRGVGEVAAVLAIGFVLLAAFLVPPQRSGVVGVDGYRALRWTSTAAVVWAGCAAALVPLTVSDATGRRVAATLDPTVLLSGVAQLDTAQAWAWTAGLALVLAVGCRMTLRWAWTPPLLVLGLLGLVPLGVTGHSSAGGAHDIATNSLMIHLVAASLWAGGLGAVLLHARAGGGSLPLAARRFSALATVAFAAVGVTGVVNALVRVSPADLLSSTYGLLVVSKAAALVVLGALGYLQRRRTVTALDRDPQDRQPFVRLALVELLVLAATVGLAVGLGRTPPPRGEVELPSRVAEELGYELAGPPTFARLALDWRFDLIFGTAAIVLAVLYLLGVRRLHRRGDTWARGRTVSWVAGCVVLLVTTSSGVGRYSTAVFSVHMGSHMALAMLTPVLLVLGGPATLALRALPAAGRESPPGPREWLLAALHSRVSSALTHPAVALALFVGSFYALYLGGIFDEVLGSHVAHVVMNGHFLLTGYLFYWVVIGVDPTPRRIPALGKLALVFVALPFHAFFLVALIGSKAILGETFYRGLGLAWNTDLAADQRLGGSLAWAAGELPLIIVITAVAAQWSRDDERTARRRDRAADRDGDAELMAYNRYLGSMSGGHGHGHGWHDDTVPATPEGPQERGSDAKQGEVRSG